MYPTELVEPMKLELTDHGFKELLTSEEVEQVLAQKGTTLFFINSVCGCSAASARPGVLMSLEGNTKKPERTVTSFAGYDLDAVKQVRSHLLPYPPSSPSIALFKDGQLVYMMERHMIEGHTPEMIADSLQDAYEAYL